MNKFLLCLIIYESLTIIQCFPQKATINEQNVECTENNFNILWPDYENSQFYYICTENGTQLQQNSCQNSQKFNFYLQKCVHDSEWIMVPNPEDIYILTTNEKYCNNGSGFWVDVENENQYFLCIDEYTAVRMKCKANEILDLETKSCMIMGESLDESNLFAPSCLADELNLLWPDPISLEHFYRCTNLGQSVRQTCPENQLFEFRIQMCFPITHTTPTLLQRAPNCTVEQLDLRWADTWNDRNYFTCRTIGEFILHQCPFDQMFYFPLQMCVINPNPPTTQMTTLRTTQLGETTMRHPLDPLECNYEDLHLLWPVINDEHGFFVCVGLGQPEKRSCPQVMVFVFQIQTCIDDPNFTTRTAASTTIQI